MILYFVVPFIISSILIPFLILFSKKNNIMDFSEGDELKIHKAPTSFFGGSAILISIVFSFLIFLYKTPQSLYIILALLIIFLLGLWDDFKWKHITKRKPIIKLCFLIICSVASALALYYAGIKFYYLPILAPLYIFVMINAVNYQDGMDGQAGLLFLISDAGFFILGAALRDNLLMFSALIFFGAVMGFMLFNYPPAKIFMGDSGAYVLGVILAFFAIYLSKNIVGHLFIIGLPLFDGIFINLKRLVQRKSIFLGDREHFYDNMLKRGFSVKQTLLISGSIQVIFVILGILAFAYEL